MPVAEIQPVHYEAIIDRIHDGRCVPFLGAIEAVNFDGGGSTQIFFLSGLTTVAGNRLGLPGVHYERMVPSVGMLP